METRGWILLGEDNPGEAKGLKRLLEEGGVRKEIILCRTGAEALSCLRREGKFHQRPSVDPAVVLLKLRLPVYDGVSVLRTIKEDLELMHLPVVIYAGSRSRERLEAAYIWGVNGYFLKPRTPREVARVFTNLAGYWGLTNIHPGMIGPAQVNRGRRVHGSS